MTRSVEASESNSGGTGLEQSPFGCGDGRGDSELTPGGVGDGRVSHNPIRGHTASSSMNADTLEALRGSIEKWEAIVAGTGIDEGEDNCPLCQKFIRNRCDGCPVAEAVSDTGCYGTPYRLSRADPTRNQKELDFLKSLLPAEAQSDDEVNK